MQININDINTTGIFIADQVDCLLPIDDYDYVRITPIANRVQRCEIVNCRTETTRVFHRFILQDGSFSAWQEIRKD